MSLRTTFKDKRALSQARKWLIVFGLILLATLIASTRVNAQVVSANPLEWAALAEGNELINRQIKETLRTITRYRICKSADRKKERQTI